MEKVKNKKCEDDRVERLAETDNNIKTERSEKHPSRGHHFSGHSSRPGFNEKLAYFS